MDRNEKRRLHFGEVSPVVVLPSSQPGACLSSSNANVMYGYQFRREKIRIFGAKQYYMHDGGVWRGQSMDLADDPKLAQMAVRSPLCRGCGELPRGGTGKGSESRR